MRIKFTDKEDKIYFEFHDKVTVPKKRIVVKNIPFASSQGTEHFNLELNPTLLQLYCLYKNALFKSYREKKDLAEDIKTKQMQFQADDEFNTFIEKSGYSEAEKGLYQYSVAYGLDVMQRWKDEKNEHMKSFVAYENIDGRDVKIGSVLFQEKSIQDKTFVYIAEAAVAKRGASIGRRLMECVISHFDSGTEFRIGTRVFNTEAKILYQDRLGFTPLSKDEVQECLGLNKERYIGFKHVSTLEEKIAIKNKQVEIDNPIKSSTTKPGEKRQRLK